MAEGTDEFIKENEELQGVLARRNQTIAALQSGDRAHDGLLAIIADVEAQLTARGREKNELDNQCQRLEQELVKARAESQPAITTPAVPSAPAAAAADSTFAMQAGTLGGGRQTPNPTQPNDVLVSLLEQFTSSTPFAPTLIDSDDEDDPTQTLNTSFTPADTGATPEGLRAIAELEDDLSEDSPSEDSPSRKAPQVRWISWRTSDVGHSYNLWLRVLEEVQSSTNVSYHTTMKDVANFLNCEHNRLEDLESVAARSPTKSPRLADDDCFHINSPETLARVKTDLTWPRVEDVVIRGRLLVDNLVTAHAEYRGGTEGNSRLTWYRIWKDEKMGQEFSEVVCRHKNAYKLQQQDIGCAILFEYVPVRRDGAVGPSVICRSPTTVMPGVPTATSPRIEGECFVLRSLWVSYKYRGASEEGPSVIRWFKSVDGYVFYEINKPRGNSSDSNSTLYLSADLTHHYIRVLIVPIGVDGTRGKPVYSKLVYVNVDDQTDEVIRDMVLKGEVTFTAHVPFQNTYSNPGQTSYLHMDGKKLRVYKSFPGGDKGGELLFGLPWNTHMQMMCHPLYANKVILQEVRKGKVTRVTLSVDSTSERDLVILAFRTFACLGQSNVLSLVLGDASKDWRKGRWKSLSPTRRAQILDKQAALPGPTFPKYQPGHRPGSNDTFLHRMEEVFIEMELELISSTKGTRKPHAHKLPFAVGAETTQS
uniref:AIR9-like A9 domain-containing protein n=1 Tax=Eutreptiella gymnastica TaxID=73025 RepID=A0A7S1IGE9_9EUGL